MEIVSPVREGVVVDWDLLEKTWNYSLTNYLKTDLTGLPVLVAEKPYATPPSRHKYANITISCFLFITFLIILLLFSH
jgi:actin-like protein 6A